MGFETYQRVGRLVYAFKFLVPNTRKGEDEPAVKGEFTVAYPHVSNEYYKGETPTSEQLEFENQPTPGQPASENSSSPASAPSFSLVTAISALVLVFLRFSHQKKTW